MSRLHAALGAPLAVLALLGAQGCAAVGLTLFATGAGIAAGTGTAYTLDGIAYRTFTAPMEDMRRATLASLKRMDIAVQSDQATDEGRALVAKAADRTVYVDLERLTARATRIRVTAKQGWFFRDRATAGEIIAQTERSLDELPALSQTTR
ncbi:MAG TPA: hypothetical protein DDZ42_08800 [Candidatus Rokubacteria bacterium]|nr:MAG: hypothetical protein A2050_01555 [Candidatus Rokubacteria bacterium GWA2_73_35]HBH02003.1 hypothetical protein [Candidatus Rokubacteria bacterium]